MFKNGRIRLAELRSPLRAAAATQLLMLAVTSLVSSLLPGGPVAADVQGTSGSVCIAAVGGTKCSAEDVDLGVYTVLSGPASCFAGEPIDVTLSLLMQNNADERYDFGMYIAEDGGDARTGTCFRDYLHPVSTDNSDLDPAGGLGPFYNGEIGVEPLDTCGDVQQSSQVTYHLPSISTICRDTDGDGFADLGTCLAWYHNDGHTCNGELDAIPGTSAKCKCDSVQVGEIVVPAFLEVVKQLVPSDDPGLFNLQIDGLDQAADQTDGGTTGEQPVSVGSHTVGETAGTDTDLADYDTSISCQNTVTNEIVASCTACTSLALDVSESVQCTITNSPAPTAITLNELRASSGGLVPAGAGAFAVLLGASWLGLTLVRRFRGRR